MMIAPIGEFLCLMSMILVPALPEPEPDPLLARGYIGVTITGTDEIVITEVLEGTPAWRAGLQKDDVITDVEGHPIHSRDDVIGLIAILRPGEIVRMQVRRGDETVKITIKVTIRPDDLPPAPGAPSPYRK